MGSEISNKAVGCFCWLDILRKMNKTQCNITALCTENQIGGSKLGRKCAFQNKTKERKKPTTTTTTYFIVHVLLNPNSASKRRERLSVQHWTLHWVLNKALSGQFSKMSDTWSDIQKHKRRQESLRERLQRRRKDRQGLGLGDNDGKN